MLIISIFMLFFHFYKIFLYFSIYNNVYPKYYQNYKKMSVNEIRDFFFENYYKRSGFSKENSYYSLKRFKKRDYCCLKTNK